MGTGGGPGGAGGAASGGTSTGGASGAASGGVGAASSGGAGGAAGAGAASSGGASGTGAGGTGGVACNPGAGDCDGDVSNGCETHLLATLAHCGACGHECVAPVGGVATCGAGRCGGTITFGAADLEDTYISDDGSEKSQNFGASTKILVDGDPVYRTLLQVPELVTRLPPGVVIQSATLQLQCFDTGAAVQVFRVLAPWSESSVAWDTQPARDAVQAAYFTASVGMRQVDLTALVQLWVDGTPNYGVILLADGGLLSGGGSDYRSSEYSDAAARPSLVVTFVEP
ncbi:MAG: DNRLRE domain-containing protein [Polyangiaceae bacterium]|nr:DNRLRE domain-containing protein [Polyangiaceae bacterium]